MQKITTTNIHQLFMHAPAGICIFRGKDYVIEMINERMLEIWGRKISDVINKPAFDVLTELSKQGFKESLDHVYHKGETFVTDELPINLNRKGKIENVFVKFIYEPLREDDGTISGVVALAQEITEQVISRRKIEESEAFNRTILESSPDCMQILDVDGRLIFININGLCALEIEDFATVKNKYWWHLWGNANQHIVKDAVSKAMLGETAGFQAFDITVKGTPKWWDVVVTPVLEKVDNKTVTHIIAVARDISAQKKAVVELEESEYRYRNMIHSSTSLILILKGENLVVEVANDAMLKSLGRGKDMLGKPLLQVVPEISEQGLGELLQQVYRTGDPNYAYEMPVLIEHNGKRELNYYTFVCQAQRSVNGAIDGVAVIANEVTQQAAFNLKIKESEERFRSLADDVPLFVFLIAPNADATISYWNKYWLAYTGQTYEQAIRSTWKGILHDEDVSGVMDVYSAAFEKKSSYFLPAIRVKRLDGEYRWHSVKANPRYSSTGEFAGYIGVGFDVHESKIAEDMLKKSEERFRNLVEKAPYPNCIFKGRDMILELANKPMLQVWNAGQEALGKSFAEIVPDLKDQPFMGWMSAVFETGKTHYGNEQPVYFTRANGEKETFYFNFVYQPYHDNDGSISGVMVLASDVTLQVVSSKKTEAQAVMVQELLMTAPGFIATLRGPTHIYEVVNEKYQQLFGKRKIQGKAIMDALPELEGQGFDDLLDRVYHTGEPYVGIDIPITMARDENLLPELRYFNFSYQPIYDIDKTIYSILVFGYEVTDQVLAKNKHLEYQQTHSKELEEKVQQRTLELSEAIEELQRKNEELFITKEKLLSNYSRNLIEATLDPLITIDINGSITDVNEAMVKATDKPRQQLIGSALSNYFIEKEKAGDMYRQVFAKGHVMNYPLSIIDGVITDVLINASIYKNDHADAVGAVIVARDITQLKKIEKELIEAKLFAEEAARKAQSATQTAENAVNSKQQFLSNMSHEIRTPMNAIIGFTKVMLKTELSAKQSDYLNAIKTSGDAMIVLINDILDLAKVNAGKMTFEQIPFKLALSISAMMHLFETKIEEKNLMLVKNYDPKIPEVLVGDPVRLHQVILNLVSNAVKFTNKGKIEINVQLMEEDEEKAVISFSIADTGIGIDKNEIPNIFNNFQQASNDTSRLYGGTGLGLAIVKQLVESQGGSIRVTSKVDEGSDFSFILPFKKTTLGVELKSESAIPDSSLRPLKILVVEDMALNQLLMKTILEDFNFECDIAANGKLAIEKLAKNTYDIILMDLQMPEMNGFEATQYIRNTLLSTIPIIALTADVTTVDLAKCKAAGMNDYIAKPVDEKLLYRKIAGLAIKPLQIDSGITTPVEKEDKNTESKKTRYTNMSYLTTITKKNPKLMTEMILLYLQQTPPLISAMKQSFLDKDWKTLQSAVHKMMPTFSIAGIHTDFEKMAKKVLEYANDALTEDGVQDMVLQLETVFTQACKEMEEELNLLKTSAYEQ